MRKTLFKSVFVAVFAALIATVATKLIHMNRGTTTSFQRLPMPVSATRFIEQSTYQRKATFLGVVRAGSDSLIGFEVAGVLNELFASEGMRVEPGQVLGRLSTDRLQTRLDTAEASLRRVNAELAQAESRTQRLAQLVKEGSASEQDYDNTRFSSEALSASREAARAERQSAMMELRKSSLVAPYSAVVVERLLQVGSVVAPGNPVLRLVASSGREAHIGVPIKVARRLTLGATYPIQLETKILKGVLRSIRDDLDPETLTVGVVFDLPASTSASVGESAMLHVEETIASVGGWLPITALLEGSKGLWDVLTITTDENGSYRAQRESIEIIHTRGEHVYVRGTIAGDTTVVSSGLQRISPGDLVDPIVAQIREGS